MTKPKLLLLTNEIPAHYCNANVYNEIYSLITMKMGEKLRKKLNVRLTSEGLHLITWIVDSINPLAQQFHKG